MRNIGAAVIMICLLFGAGCTAVTQTKVAENQAPVSMPETNTPEPVTLILIENPAEPTPPTPTNSMESYAEFNAPFPASGVPVLMYHSIANLPGNDLGVPPEKFAQQMKYLYDTGFSSITLDRLYDAFEGRAKLPAKPVVITFDDGYPDNYFAAFPVLKQYRFTAVIFLITAGLDRGMLTWNQVEEMQFYGISIGSHTVNHVDLATLSPDGQKQELKESKAALEAKQQREVSYFCYPFGKYNASTLTQLKVTGYKMAFTTVYGKVKQGDNLFELKRIRINGSDSMEGFKQKVSL